MTGVVGQRDWVRGSIGRLARFGQCFSARFGFSCRQVFTLDAVKNPVTEESGDIELISSIGAWVRVCGGRADGRGAVPDRSRSAGCLAGGPYGRAGAIAGAYPPRPRPQGRPAHRAPRLPAGRRPSRGGRLGPPDALPRSTTASPTPGRPTLPARGSARRIALPPACADRPSGTTRSGPAIDSPASSPGN